MHGVAHRFFTLFELIVVMALLAVIMAVAVPQLSGFAHGRSLQSEADRFLSLTRLAAAEAASRAEYMELWIDTENGAYGLQVATNYPNEDYAPRSYQLTDGLEIHTDGGKAVTGVFFTPEGLVDADDIKEICIQRRHDESDRLCLKLDADQSQFIVAEDADE